MYVLGNSVPGFAPCFLRKRLNSLVTLQHHTFFSKNIYFSDYFFLLGGWGGTRSLLICTTLSTNEFGLDFQGVSAEQLINNNTQSSNISGKEYISSKVAIYGGKSYNCSQVPNLGIDQDIFLACSHKRFRTITKVSPVTLGSKEIQAVKVSQRFL